MGFSGNASFHRPAILLQGLPCGTPEVAAHIRRVGEMELLGDLLDGFGGVDELVFQLRDRLPRDGLLGCLAAVFSDDDGQVVGRHTELIGIEPYVAVLAEMLLHKEVEVAALPLNMRRAGTTVYLEGLHYLHLVGEEEGMGEVGEDELAAGLHLRVVVIVQQPDERQQMVVAHHHRMQRYMVVESHRKAVLYPVKESLRGYPVKALEVLALVEKVGMEVGREIEQGARGHLVVLEVDHHVTLALLAIQEALTLQGEVAHV